VIIDLNERSSDSPLVEMIWHSQSSEQIGASFISKAVTNLEMVFMRQYGQTSVGLRGPETKATPAPIPENADFFGITFKLGTYLPHLPTSILTDSPIALPNAAGQSFWLHGSTWQFPDFENADTFVTQLVRQGLLVHDPVVNGVLQDQTPNLSIRQIRRHFLSTTGLSYSTIRQIERARQAALLLEQGRSILDVIYETGYYDQPHLTRSLKLFMGQTPAQIAHFKRPE
jgi:AraC-like DNA-binding protein